MKCKYIKKDGKQCEGYAVENSRFCFFHTPDLEEKRQQASLDGGSKTAVGNEPLEPVQCKDNQSVTDLLQDTINRVRRTRKDGSMDIKTANCLGFLAGKIIEANKVKEKQKEEVKEEKVPSKFEIFMEEDPMNAMLKLKEFMAPFIKYAKDNIRYGIGDKIENENSLKIYEESIAEIDQEISKLKINDAFHKIESAVS